MDLTKKLTHLSLCAGYGGIDLGLQRAIKSIRTICFVEIEAYAIANLVKKIEEGLLDLAPIYTDVKTLPWEIFNQKVDILSGGFPCQPFSAAGRRKADRDPRHLWPYIRRGIEICRPAIIFLENVEGIFSAKLKGDSWADAEGTPILLHILRELERLGYRAEAGIFSAAEVGAPHQRKRAFIMGVRSSISEESKNYVTRLIKQSKKNDDIWPASRGISQYPYEPPRVTMGHTNGKRQFSRGKHKLLSEEAKIKTANRSKRADSLTFELSSKAKPKMGRDANGATHRMGYDELQKSYFNRTDELRLLGNGVIPATAEKAFKTLWRELDNPVS